MRKALAEIPDCRQSQGRRYSLLSVLLLSCVAVMCGAKSQSAIAEWGHNYGRKWLRKLGIKRQHGPSQPTLHRIFKELDSQTLEAVLSCWMESILELIPLAEDQLEGLAMDGKTMRGAARQQSAENHLLGVISHRLGVVVKQLAVADKSQEKGSFEQILEGLLLTGKVLTSDALHTSRENAALVVEKGGDYLQVVKDNQPDLVDDLKELFREPERWDKTLRVAEEFDLHANRIETRRLRVSSALEDYLDYPFQRQVMELQRFIRNKKSGEERFEVVYAITSLSRERAGAEELLKLWREHWHIENRLHYVRDVTFDEDRSQVRDGKAPQVMAAMRNLAISLLRLAGAENIASATRKYAANPALAFAALNFQLKE